MNHENHLRGMWDERGDPEGRNQVRRLEQKHARASNGLGGEGMLENGRYKEAHLQGLPDPRSSGRRHLPCLWQER